MNKKITLLFLQILFVSTQFISAQQIYTNGPLSTGATSNSGVAAPAGYTWSECQNDDGITTESNTNAGFGATFNNAVTVNNVLADDFIVPVGETWDITSIDVFAYQTGSTATEPPFDQLRVQIFSGTTGGPVVAGNLTTNVLDVTNSADALMYRIFNSSIPAPGTAPGTTRKIWRLRGTITATLAPGTYWVAYQAHPTNDGNAFFPPVTIIGSRGQAGWNAAQSTLAVPAYTGVFDTGNPNTAADILQDMAFNINGTVTPLNIDENAFDASVTLSPNPVKDLLTISVPTNLNVSSYEIVDLNGKVVKSMTSALSISEINVSELSVGNYILKLSSDQGNASKKFIKE